MSWILSAIVLCGTLAVFAAGTLDGRTFRFPKLALDHLMDERHLINRREDTRSAHVEDEESCTLDSEEYIRRAEVLRCNEEYMRAVREEIERSNCVSEVFDPDTNGYDEPHDCVVTDERDDVNVRCTEGCATNQAEYLACKYLGEEAVALYLECGGMPEIAEIACTYNDKGYCGIEPFTPSNVPTIYDECFRKNNMSASNCSNECKEALEFMVDEQGCCTNIYSLFPLGYLHNDVPINSEQTLSEELFSACGIEIPETCTKRFPPPEEFLACARDANDKNGDVHVSPTIISSILLIMVALFNAL